MIYRLILLLMTGSVAMGANFPTVSIDPPDNTTGLTLGGYTLSGSSAASGVSLSGTWNTSGNPSALKLTITDTASGSTSKAIEVLGGAAGTTALFTGTKSGAWLVGDGSSAAPSLGFISDADGTGSGFYRRVANRFTYSGNGTSYLELGASWIQFRGDGQIHWTDGAIGGTVDTILLRDSANTLQMGLDAASPSAQAFKGPDATGTDGSGGSLSVTGGNSTGTGRGGSVIIRTANSSTTGSSVNTFTDRARYVPKFVSLTDGTITTIFTVTLPATNNIGMSFTCTVQAGDGTDFQSLTTPVTVDAVNKAGTITAVVSPTAAQTALAGSTGTLSVTYAVADGGSNTLQVRVTADTSLTPTYLRARIVMTGINIMGAGTVINEI